MGSTWLDVISDKRYETHTRVNPSGAKTSLPIRRRALGPIEAETAPKRTATRSIDERSCNIQYKLKEGTATSLKLTLAEGETFYAAAL
jgi:hypothetical protein